MTNDDPALFAYLAAGEKGRIDEVGLGEVAEEVGLELTGRSMRNVPDKSTRLRERHEARKSLALNRRRATLTDLGFFEAVVFCRGTPEVEKDLPATPGVFEMIVSEDPGEFILIVGYEISLDRDRLRAALNELVEILSWTTVRFHDVGPAYQSWVALAHARLLDGSGK